MTELLKCGLERGDALGEREAVSAPPDELEYLCGCMPTEAMCTEGLDRVPTAKDRVLVVAPLLVLESLAQ
jgi:hypothetical protein